MALKATGSFTALQVPVIDQHGRLSYTWLKQFQQWQLQLSSGFDVNGNLIGNINPTVKIVGRTGNIGSILQHISATGVIDGAGMAPATTLEQGAVVLPAGATSNTLGTAAIEPSTAFDPAGAAAAAQSNAQTFATGAANTAQSNAEAFASDASNLATGTVALARLPGINVTITTAALTVGGTQGSQTFVNGVLTAQVQAT
jgi:hypothetical protein